MSPDILLQHSHASLLFIGVLTCHIVIFGSLSFDMHKASVSFFDQFSCTGMLEAYFLWHPWKSTKPSWKLSKNLNKMPCDQSCSMLTMQVMTWLRCFWVSLTVAYFGDLLHLLTVAFSMTVGSAWKLRHLVFVKCECLTAGQQTPFNWYLSSSTFCKLSVTF